MLDGNYKNHIDQFWNYLAKGLAKTGISPNQITISGLFGVALACIIYEVFSNTLIFAILLIFCFAADSLDGAVARVTNTSSLFGSYLDAVVDRYQEILVLLTIAHVHQLWLVCFLAVTGSLLVSYNKARTAIEVPVENNGWPDLMERMERIILLIAGLVAEGIFPGKNLLFYSLSLLAGLTHFTALQRFFRAKKMLEK